MGPHRDKDKTSKRKRNQNQAETDDQEDNPRKQRTKHTEKSYTQNRHNSDQNQYKNHTGKSNANKASNRKAKEVLSASSSRHKPNDQQKLDSENPKNSHNHYRRRCCLCQFHSHSESKIVHVSTPVPVPAPAKTTTLNDVALQQLHHIHDERLKMLIELQKSQQKLNVGTARSLADVNEKIEAQNCEIKNLKVFVDQVYRKFELHIQKIENLLMLKNFGRNTNNQNQNQDENDFTDSSDNDDDSDLDDNDDDEDDIEEEEIEEINLEEEVTPTLSPEPIPVPVPATENVHPSLRKSIPASTNSHLEPGNRIHLQTHKRNKNQKKLPAKMSKFEKIRYLNEKLAATPEKVQSAVKSVSSGYPSAAEIGDNNLGLGSDQAVQDFTNSIKDIMEKDKDLLGPVMPVAGKQPCPYCKKQLTIRWLNKGHKCQEGHLKKSGQQT